MKILGGKYSGRKIKTLSEQELRPTTTMVREAIFNILIHNNLFSDKNFFDKDKVFLELFCGYGLMSLEMLSRGMGKAILLDYNPKLKKLFTLNAQNIICDGATTQFLLCDIQKEFKKVKIYDQIDLCFIDPPYNKNLCTAVLKQMAVSGILQHKALIIIENDKRNILNYSNEYYKLCLEKIYGKSKLTFLLYEANN